MYGQDVHIQGPQINQFNNIAPRAIPRSTFQRDFTRRTTFDQDYLVPVFVDEILPGDDVHVKMTAFCRMSTPIKPLMDNLFLETFWFFIPNRLVWANWKKFQGEQINPNDSVDYTIPVLDKTLAPMSTTGFTVQSIYDYLGMPTEVTSLDDVSCLYNRAYDLCWDEWFRDENLQNSVTIPLTDGPDNPANYVLRKRNKRKDYFTSSLPWPQKGDEVPLPIFGQAPVKGIAARNTTYTTPGTGNMYETGGTGPITYASTKSIDGSSTNTEFLVRQDPDNPGFPAIYADLTGNVDNITMNALRQVAIYQQILELDARGGTRYVESIYSRFGVISPDFRLQRPELIGQGSTPINVYSVPQTAPTGETGTPQGNLAAFATATVQGHGCRYSATEHGMIIGLANVRADLTYQQGLPRRYSRRTRLDFYEPLQNGLGEQAVLRKEIYATGVDADDNSVWGYQERFAEYRFMNSEITGKFRSTYAQTLDVWHLSQELSNPQLNGTFVQEGVPMSRVLAVPTEPAFLMDAHFAYNHVRPMPIRSNPGIDIL